MSLRNALPSALLKKLVVLSMVGVLSACAVWTKVDTANQEGPDNKYSVQAPLGWVRFSAAQDGILITRDGIAIQHIFIAQRKDEDFFKHTKVKLPKNVPPSDLAQLILAEMRSDPDLANLQIKEIAPYSIGGQAGFKAHLQYRNERGALFDRIVLGAAKDNLLTVMRYHGLNTHYFARDVETFYSVAKSFKAT